MNSDIILTGLPRSGTTLACHLLNRLPSSVALHEPMYPISMRGMSREQAMVEVRAFFKQQREQIITSGWAVSKASGGKVPLNHLSDPDANGVRRSIIDGRAITVEVADKNDFRLVIKHPAFFTACLRELEELFDCYALVRNPLSLMLSWRNTPFDHGAGRASAAEGFDPELGRRLDGEPDLLERQFILLDYYFDRYVPMNAANVLRYEALVISQGRALSVIDPAAETLSGDLQDRNALWIDTDEEARAVAERLLARESPCWLFYARSEVEALVAG